MAFLPHSELRAIADAMVNTGFQLDRVSLIQGIRPSFIAALPVVGTPNAQILSDLVHTNRIERLRDGSVPLEIYLGNAAFLLGSDPNAEKVIREALDRVTLKASGAPKIDLNDVPEIEEKIIFTDDTVSHSFMSLGHKAAASVMKLRVPRFENGAVVTRSTGPVIYLGTGWLLGRSLLITNHHVINARNEDEPNAAEPDLRLQAAATTAELDFDAEGTEPATIQAGVLLAWDVTLDYAVVEIDEIDRPPLLCAPKAVSADAGPVPVNIIQHPGGRAKRYGIRNNLVSAATEIDLRYFTDTESGSSGSPVFNDSWQVVALHKASKFVSGVEFQGKPTAYVNIGTHISKVIADIRSRFPEVADRIGN